MPDPPGAWNVLPPSNHWQGPLGSVVGDFRPPDLPLGILRNKNPASKLWEDARQFKFHPSRAGPWVDPKWNMADLSLLKSVAEQLMAAGTGEIVIDGQTVTVKQLGSGRLRSVRFQMNGRDLQAIEQNPEKPSRWGKLARDGHQVVQFRDVLTNRYLAVAVDGEVKDYEKPERH
jgi:hypothetical protein